MLNSLLVSIFPILVLFAAFYDMLTMRIPNWISIALIVGFVVVALICGFSFAQIGWHFAYGLLILVVGFTLFAFSIVGGGDVKFATTAGIWIGFQHGLEFLLFFSILGGVLTLFLLLFRLRIPQAILPQWAWLSRLHDKTKGVPYGIALAAGALIVYPQTEIFSALITIGR